MEFTYHGAGSVLIATKQLKILVDPPESTPKPKLPKADVILRSRQAGEGFSAAKVFEIDTPGEFEIKNVGIVGVAAQLHIDKPEDPWQGVMYVLENRGVRALISGDIAPTLSDQQTEAIGHIDVLVVPVGGHGLTLDANAASAIVGRLEPSYVIPVHYDDGHTKYPVPQDKVEVFLKEMGSEDTQELSKFKVTDKVLETGATSVVLLKPQP